MTGQKNDGAIYVWAGTAFVASAIVGFCIFIALGQKKPALVEPISVPPIEKVAPVQPEIKIPKPQPQAVTPAPAPVPAMPGESGAPKLLLNNLAGTLRIDVPFTQSRDKMPLEHTCYRNNMSPALNWQGAPPATKSYVVFLEKREQGAEDAFVNWILFDIPAATKGLVQAQPRDPVLADGSKHANGDHKTTGYIGPCEARGNHTYALRVFALDKVLGLPPATGKHDLIRAMNGHIIDAAEKEFTHYYRM